MHTATRAPCTHAHMHVHRGEAYMAEFGGVLGPEGQDHERPRAYMPRHPQRYLLPFLPTYPTPPPLPTYILKHLSEFGGVLGAQGQDDEGEVLVLRALLPQLSIQGGWMGVA